jgi:hypothetical protein
MSRKRSRPGRPAGVATHRPALGRGTVPGSAPLEGAAATRSESTRSSSSHPSKCSASEASVAAVPAARCSSRHPSAERRTPNTRDCHRRSSFHLQAAAARSTRAKALRYQGSAAEPPSSRSSQWASAWAVAPKPTPASATSSPSAQANARWIGGHRFEERPGSGEGPQPRGHQEQPCRADTTLVVDIRSSVRRQRPRARYGNGRGRATSVMLMQGWPPWRQPPGSRLPEHDQPGRGRPPPRIQRSG